MASGVSEANEESMLACLRRLLAEPGCLGGLTAGARGSKSNASRRLLDQLSARGYVTLDRSDKYQLTETGRDWLLEKENPRVLLEDLLRATEQADDRLQSLELLLREQRDRLQRQCDAVARVLGRLPAGPGTGPIDRTIEELLRSHEASGAPADCSLVELYQKLRRQQPDLSIGQFHDRLRTLHEAGMLGLAPWTGPLYELPEPRLALLIGHEVLYYVHRARRHAA